MDFINRLSGRGSLGSVSPAAFFKFTDLDVRVQKHLQKVYVTLALAVAVMAFGAAVDVALHVGGMLTSLAAFASLVALQLTPATPANQTKRAGMLGSFALCQGAALGPLVGLALQVDPALLLTALLGTSLAFACFSAAALVTQRRSYLFLGGWLSTAVLGFMGMRLVTGLLGGARFWWGAELYGGLLLFSGYVLFDTQLIVERASAGDWDVIGHALDLFVDFVGLAVRLLVILLQNQERKQRQEQQQQGRGRKARRD